MTAAGHNFKNTLCMTAIFLAASHSFSKLCPAAIQYTCSIFQNNVFNLLID